METRPFKQRAVEALLRYVLFILFSAGSLFLMLRFRDMVLLVGGLLHMTVNDIWILDVSGFVVLGGLYLAFVAIMDSYFLGKIPLPLDGSLVPVLLRRAKKITLYEAIAAVVALGLGWIFQAWVMRL